MSLLKQANHALRNGQYETAIRLYQQSLQDSPALAHIIQSNLKLAQSRHQKTGTAARQPSLPALPPKSSIDFAAMRVEDIISGAEQAMARDDWRSAYEHWNSLLTRPDEELSPQLLLRTSRELFKLDAFPQAAAALQRAATRNPQDPDVIREQAHQYYYHCYSSWLMLVTENEPDWYKADGLDKRPDWKTACELLEKAEKVSPRHNLRRYVQAYLLLAEDAWDKQNRTQAHAALHTALKAIGPNKLDQTLVQAIHTAVDQFRDGQVPENDPYYQTLQDQLKAMPLELLDVKNWLCLNDILNWNGLLLCGYVAREKAVDLALEQGKKENANKATLKTALKAALDRNDTKLADTYLGKLKRISPDAIDVRELDSCTELMKGNLDAFRQKWPHPPTPAEQRLRDYLKGKTVAVVGPAPTGTLDGEEIDRHDVVVRMNWRGQDSMPDAREFGSKTNISLYNAHTVRLLTADKRLEQTKSLDFRLIRRARHDAHQLQMIAEYPGSFYKSLNAVPAILFNLLLHGAEQIKLFKVSFYLGKQHHAESYRGQVDDGFDGMPLRGLQPVMANHDLVLQKNIINGLHTKKFVKIDLINFFKESEKYYYKELLRVNNFIAKKKKRAIILSSGIYATLIATYICKKEKIDECDIFLYSKNLTKEFVDINLDFNNNLSLIKNTYFLNDFLENRIINEEKFKANYNNEVELILTPGVTHWMLAPFLAKFKEIKRILYEEGMGSYEQFSIDKKEISKIEKAYYIRPHGISYPSILNINKKQIVEINRDDIKTYFDRFTIADKSININSNTVLILGMGLNIYNIISLQDEYDFYKLIINIFLDKGYQVLFKGHPRDEAKTSNLLMREFKNKISIINDEVRPIELFDFVQKNNNIKLVVGGPSTALYNLSWLYGLRCCTFKKFLEKLPFNSPEFKIWNKTLRLFDCLMVDEHVGVVIESRLSLPVVSIIIPSFNVEKYLAECLQSLVHQSYRNLDVIIVNDGSSDKTGEIAELYAQQYSFIRVIHQKNKGLSGARNTGLNAAVGEFFCFLDSDDWLSFDAIETLVSVAVSTSADIVRSSFYAAPENKPYIKNNVIKQLKLENKVLKYDDNESLLVDLYISSCIGIYRRTKELEKIRFPINLKYEDNYYYWLTIRAANKIAIVDVATYYYRKREGSITNNIGLNDIDIIKTYKELYYRFRSDLNYTKDLPVFKKRFEKVVWGHMRRVLNTDYFVHFCKEAIEAFELFGYKKTDMVSRMPQEQFSLLINSEFELLKKNLLSLDK